MKNDPLRVKSFQLALEAIKLYKYLVDERNEFVMSKQILRSATSIGANMEEGLVAYTKKEFFFKYNLSFKELKETIFWLRLLYKSNFINKTQFDSLFGIADQIGAMLFKTLQKNKK